MPTPTPVRALGRDDPAGFRLLRDPGLSYRDGAEEAVLRIVGEAKDISSGSVEMMLSASGWAQRYHVDPSRSNIIRCLDLPSSARVLEVGAGCGAITRYLGERCAVVDAVEPMPARAAVASARTRDLPGVQVFVGELDDVPPTACYDVVVVIGVLEYVGRGSADRQPYLDFLRGIRARLVEGGTLVLAIENELGVKYLAGSPEDHTNRVFDSIEGYPRGGRARTFSRRALEQLVVDAGLRPRTRIAFPDYKLTRVVFGDVPEHARSLLHRVPRFPSPDWRARRPRLADEHSLWRRLVEAGLEVEFGNSFLVLAGNGADSPLWPSGQAGAFYTTDRRAHLNASTVIETADDGAVWFRRTLDRDGADPGAAVRATASDIEFRAGTDLTEVVARDGAPAFGRHVAEWLSLLDAGLATDPGSAVDLIPHNMVVDDQGRLTAIDVELIDSSVTRDRVVRRGVFWLAVRATPLAVPERWDGAATVRDVMCQLGDLAGLAGDAWIDQAIAEEAAFLARVRPGPPRDRDLLEWTQEIEVRLRGYADRRLTDQPLGERLPDRYRQAMDDAKAAKAEIRRLKKDLAASERRLAEASTEPARRGTPTLRGAVVRAFPRGTKRRAVLDQLRPR